MRPRSLPRQKAQKSPVVPAPAPKSTGTIDCQRIAAATNKRATAKAPSGGSPAARQQQCTRVAKERRGTGRATRLPQRLRVTHSAHGAVTSLQAVCMLCESLWKKNPLLLCDKEAAVTPLMVQCQCRADTSNTAYPMNLNPSSDSTTFGLLMSCSVSSPNWWSSLAPQANTTDSIGGLDTHSGTSRHKKPTGESGISTCPSMPLSPLYICWTDMTAVYRSA